MTVTVTLPSIRRCLEGAVPGVMSTCSLDGVPNVAYLSQVEYVDVNHVALSFQFFNKTRQNILLNPLAQLLVADGVTGAMYRLSLRYMRTETEGPLFQRMKAKLAGIASLTGMADVFRLRGSDIYRVDDIEALPMEPLPEPPDTLHRLTALRRATGRLLQCADLEALLETGLDILEQEFQIAHAMVLILDWHRQRLYTVASRGYPRTGIGSEIALDDGVIGVAARHATPIRISHFSAEYAYGQAVREQVQREGGWLPGTEIAYPGLARPHSQLAVPITAGERVLGVLFVESPQDLRFSYDDEDALLLLAQQAGLMIRLMQQHTELEESSATVSAPAPSDIVERPAQGRPLAVRYFRPDGSVFLDDHYLIKGVAGAILWKVLCDHARDGRTEFSNRELRLDPAIPLPDVSDNLDARLLLLKRRLTDRQAAIQLEKCGRGRFRLSLSRRVQLSEMPAS